MTKSAFQEELQRVFSAAQGETCTTVVAGDLHRRVGGYPNRNHHMRLCCRVMREAMRVGDEEIQSPASGAGASLKIQYRLPRPG